jgi:hypothetical protein
MTISISPGRMAPARRGVFGPGRRRGQGRLGRITCVTGFAVALGLALSGCNSTPPSSSAAAAASSRPRTTSAQSCAWPTEIGVQEDNLALDADTAARYWIQPIVASGDARIVISGRYPDARYASLSVYLPDGRSFTSNGIGSSLPDYRIAPQPGSLNPWQRRAAPGGRFTVTITADTSPGQVNTLPLPSGATSKHPGWLFYRIYLPAGGVALPTLTVQQGDAAHTLPACQRPGSTLPVASGAPGSVLTGPGAAGTPPPLEFFMPPRGELFPNSDTAYVIAYLTRPPATDVVVVTAKAPTFAPGTSPSPWPARGEDMRYWSMCVGGGGMALRTVVNTLPGGETDYGCRADQATRLSPAGDYAYVIGSESQSAAIDSVPGVTFLPFSASQPGGTYLLALRNTLVSGSFTHSVEDVTQAWDPAAAAAAMGPYYPRASVCSLASLEAKGPLACQR